MHFFKKPVQKMHVYGLSTVLSRKNTCFGRWGYFPVCFKASRHISSELILRQDGYTLMCEHSPIQVQVWVNGRGYFTLMARNIFLKISLRLLRNHLLLLCGIWTMDTITRKIEIVISILAGYQNKKHNVQSAQSLTPVVKEHVYMIRRR